MSYSVTLSILAVFGVIGVTLSNIERRKKELGIKFALGAEPLFLCKLMLGELSVMFLVAASMEIVVSTFIPDFVGQYTLGMMINSSTFIYSIVLCFILIVFSSLLPAIKILKANLISLIRGTTNE